MQHILVVAQAGNGIGPALPRALQLARAAGARVTVVGFVHEPLGGVPSLSDAQAQAIRESLTAARLKALQSDLKRNSAACRNVPIQIEMAWEKRPAEWVVREARPRAVDLVIKTGQRTESWSHTPTDWQLLRSCPVPVLIVAGRAWRKRGGVLAAVDLGTRLTAKRTLNMKIADTACALAGYLGAELQFAYAVPFSKVLRDLGVVDKRQITDAAQHLAAAFDRRLSERGIDTVATQVKAGLPEKVLTSIAAAGHADIVVLGCIGRRALSGKVIGNTAERILRYLKTDVLVVKPEPGR